MKDLRQEVSDVDWLVGRAGVFALGFVFAFSALQQEEEMGLLDPNWKYTHSTKTDIRKTFAKARKEIEAKKRATAQPTTEPAAGLRIRVVQK